MTKKKVYNGKAFNVNIHNLKIKGKKVKREIIDQVDAAVVLAFDGNDADAESLEKSTGLTILGDCVVPFPDEKPCIISGRMTTKRNHLARMY